MWRQKSRLLPGNWADQSADYWLAELSLSDVSANQSAEHLLLRHGGATSKRLIRRHIAVSSQTDSVLACGLVLSQDFHFLSLCVFYAICSKYKVETYNFKNAKTRGSISSLKRDIVGYGRPVERVG